ncbi:MAG: hypothetical protein ACXAEU_24390 [Candidatus Hodarchaeales archaeon]|jgi:hypothetical protein
MMKRKISKQEMIMRNEVKIFRKMINSLYMDALKHGGISAEEKALLQQIEIGFKEFSNTVGDALKDGVLTLDEADQLKRLQLKIMKSVTNTAVADNMITDEEEVILRKLADYLLYLVLKIDQTSKKDEDTANNLY